MAEIAVEYLVPKLEDLIFKETNKQRAAEVTKIKAEFEKIRPFLKYADWKRLVMKDNAIETLVLDVIDLACEVENMIDDDWFNRSDSRGSSLSSLWGLMGESLNYFIDGKTKNDSHISIALLRKRVSEKFKRVDFRRHIPSFNPIVETRDENSLWHSKTFVQKLSPTQVVGRDREVEMLKEWLLGEDVDMPHLVAVTGVCGIGKTSVARTVYEGVKRYFDCAAWVVVSGRPTRSVLEDVFVGFARSPFEMMDKRVLDELDEEGLSRRIYDYLVGKKFILAVDDLVTLDAFEDLKRALPMECRGKVLMTTRNSSFHAVLCKHVLRLEPLIHKDAMDLLKRIVYRQHYDLDEVLWPSSLEPVVEKILQICEGHPMLVAVVGGILSTTGFEETRNWDKVFAMLKEVDESWPRSNLIQKFLVLSYFSMPPVLKCCFLYTGVFPSHYEIPCKKLIRMWVAEGFITKQLLGMTEEEVARNLLDELICRNLLEVASVDMNGEIVSCRLLGLMRDFILEGLNRNHFFVISESSRHICPLQSTRIIAIHGQINNNMTNLNTKLVHSLLLFRENGHRTPSILLNSLSNIKFLRVLELSKISIDSLPDAVGNLVLLRYMSLRGTRICNLPSSLGNLHELQTLDIRDTHVRALPGGFDGLKMLRHLLLADSYGNRVVKLDVDIMFFKDLQTLAGIKLTQSIAFGLKYLPQLLKLSVGEVEGRGNSLQLSRSIDQMKNLISLTIKCAWRKEIQIQTSNSLETLEKLRVGGWVRNLLSWVSSLKSLKYLYLQDCMLTDDPISGLQFLPRLTVLSLCNAYKGNFMSCDDAAGFPNLKKLSLLNLEEFSEWRKIEDGAMRSLEIIIIAKCPKLKLLPKGFENLTNLQVMQIKDMPADFVREAREMPLNGDLHFSVVC